MEFKLFETVLRKRNVSLPNYLIMLLLIQFAVIILRMYHSDWKYEKKEDLYI